MSHLRKKLIFSKTSHPKTLAADTNQLPLTLTFRFFFRSSTVNLILIELQSTSIRELQKVRTDSINLKEQSLHFDSFLNAILVFPFLHAISWLKTTLRHNFALIIRFCMQSVSKIGNRSILLIHFVCTKTKIYSFQ